MLRPGAYFCCIQANEKEELAVGDLVVVSEIAEAEVSFFSLEHSYTTTLDFFLDHFEFDPQGVEKRNAEAEKAIKEMDQLCLQPKLSITQPPTLDEVVNSTDLALPDQLQMRKQEVSLAKARMAELQEKALAKQERIEALMEEKKKIFELQLTKFQEIAAVFSEALWSINLYAGVGEQIVQIAKGEPCSASEIVKIRQKLLYMDEECKMNPKKGGMDFQRIEEFDEWVIRPDNLRQVLPERKGVVALRVRRSKITYGDDPWFNEAMNKENMRTYFLIRNGGNIYRIYAEITVGSVLFPRRDEYDECFVKEGRFGDEDKPIRPGTTDYMKALKQANGQRRHFLRILLILQGLFDRTDVFRPFEGDKVNLLDRREQSTVFEFIHDDEMLLSDGVERYTEWIERINNQLQVGCRIVGSFDGYGRDMEHRITPRRAVRPKSLVLHTIERRDGKAFVILYKREGEVVYTNWYHDEHEAKVRASCQIFTDDDFIINVDATSYAEIDYYINSRLDRHNYIKMIPLLEAAREVKQEEEKVESPFLKLLAGTLIRGYKVSQGVAEKSAAELMRWWKFRNKTHRAMTSDDKKALTEIVREFGTRLEAEEQAKNRAKNAEKIVTFVREQNVSTVYIGHKKDNEYVSYASLNDENVFLQERLWKYNGNTGELRLVESKDWRILDKRFERWRTLWKDAKFDTWTVNPRLPDILSDPERMQIIQEVVKQAKGRDWPLAATWKREDATFLVFLAHSAPVMDEKHLINSRPSEPKVMKYSVGWKRMPNSLVISITDTNEVQDNYWEHDHWAGKIVWQDQKNLAKFEAERRQYKNFCNRAGALKAYCDNLDDSLDVELRKKKELEVYSDFLKENHPSLWPKHKAKFVKDGNHAFYVDTGTFRDRLYYLAERGFELAGKTVAFVISESANQGYKPKDPNMWMGYHDRDKLTKEEREADAAKLASLPQDFVLSTTESLAELQKAEAE